MRLQKAAKPVWRWNEVGDEEVAEEEEEVESVVGASAPTASVPVPS